MTLHILQVITLSILSFFMLFAVFADVEIQVRLICLLAAGLLGGTAFAIYREIADRKELDKFCENLTGLCKKTKNKE